MISIAPAPAKKLDEINLHISVELNTKTRFKGFKVEVVELSTTAPYSPLIDSLRGYSDTFFIHKKLLKHSLKQNTTYQDPSSFALEIKTLDGNELAGLLTFDLKSPDKLFINGLGIFERFQRNGLGTLLMSHAIEIANFKGIRRVQLESDQRSLSFYKDKIGMTAITDRNLMQLNISQTSKHQVDEYSHSFKKIPHMIHVIGKSKYLP